MTDLVLIAAVAANGVIGADGDMPWHLPADLRHFKETTMGHPVIVGRRTYESIAARLGGPLPGRTNVVLTSRDLDVPSTTPSRDRDAPTEVLLARGVEDALDAARRVDDEVAFVAGGATVYEQFLPLADRLVLTELDEAFEGDTYFPEWDEGEWTVVERDDREGFAFVTYERA